MEASPFADYLKDEIAFGAIKLVEVPTETPSTFSSLFLKILQDLEKAEKQGSRRSVARQF